MFELDSRSRLPIYEQLIEIIKQLIISKALKPDEQLPPVRVLAQQLTINPNTIQKAYKELERQEYIYSLIGKGHFVSPAIEHMNHEQKKLLQEELLKKIAEAMHLGMSREELLLIIAEAEKISKEH